MSVTLYTAPLPLIVSSQCLLALCGTMATLNRESNLLVLSLIGVLREVENDEKEDVGNGLLVNRVDKEL